MPVILSDSSWNSTQKTSYYEKLTEAAKTAWLKSFKRSPYLAIQGQWRAHQDTEFKTAKLQNTVLFDCLRRMDACRLEKPCGIFRCRRCAAKKLFDNINRVAPIISQYTTARRGIAIAIGVGSENWNGKLHDKKYTVLQEIHTLHNILSKLGCLDGHRLALDIKVTDTSRGPRFHLHLHGTLLSNEHDIEQLRDRLENETEQHGLLLEIWLQPIVGKWSSNGPGMKSTLCNFTDVSRWLCYSEKLNTIELSTKHHCELHAELHNLPTIWTGGKLLTEQTAVFARSNRQVDEIQRELSDLVQLQQQHGIADQFTSEVAEINQLFGEIHRINFLRSERERKRYERRQKAFAKQRFTFNSVARPAVRERWTKKSKRHRLQAKQALDQQRAHYRETWQTIWRRITNMLKRTIQLLAKNEQQTLLSLNQYIEQASRAAQNNVRQSLLCGAVSVASMITGMRKRLVGYMRLAGSGFNSDPMLQAAIAVEEHLRDLNRYWPAIRKSESCLGLNWRRFWSAWRRLILRWI